MLFPGKSIISPARPRAIEPAPLPTREDPSIKARSDELKAASRKRVGRAASVLTTAESTLGDPTINRPQGRGASVLG